MNNRLFLLFTAICLIFNGCVVVAEPPVTAETEQPEFAATENFPENTSTPVIPTETAPPTLVPASTETPLPTIDKHPPTPTVERPVEWDIDPYIQYEIEGEYKGVKIKASVIIDRSLEPLVEGIYVNKNVFSEMIAKSFAYVWYSRRNNYYVYEQYIRFTTDEMDKWFELWATAQETGSEYYWRQVQLDNVWANDLNDGDGYVQKQYAFWPMYEGPTPYGVTAINKITVMLFDTPKSDIRNAMTGPIWVSGGRFHGVNLDNNNFIFYSGTDMDVCIENVMYKYGRTREIAAKDLLYAYWFIFPPYIVMNNGINDINALDGGDLSFSEEMFEIIKRATEYKLKIE